MGASRKFPFSIHFLSFVCVLFIFPNSSFSGGDIFGLNTGRRLLVEDSKYSSSESELEAPALPLEKLYGPKGINDPSFSPEGKIFTLDESDDPEYLEELKQWTTTDLNAMPSPSSAELDPHLFRKRDGKVRTFFRGEFGYELMVVLPFAYFHFLEGDLALTVSCGDEAALFYWFSGTHQVDSTCVRNDYKNILKPYKWRRGLHRSRIPPEWTPPPLAVHFRELGKVWNEVETGSPLVIISNKLSNEWKRGPINFLDLEELKFVITAFVKAGYYVVYNRPGNAIAEDRWQSDNSSLRFEDYKLVRKMYIAEEFRGKVRLMQDVHHENPGISFNEAQVRMMAQSRCFVSVQGGNSILSSYFGGHNIVYARLGFEVDFNTYNSHYKRLSGARIHVARSYYRVRKLAFKMIGSHVCDSL